MGRWWLQQWRAMVRSRTAEVRLLVVMLLVSATAASLGALLPMTPAAPTRLNAVLAVVGFTMALAVWSRPRWRPWRLVGPAVVVGGVAGIVQLADAWSHELRPGDLLSRWGGDEFVLVLPGADRAAATATVRRLAAVSACGWSYGVASYAPGGTLDALLHDADADLYRAKSRRAAGVPTAV